MGAAGSVVGSAAVTSAASPHSITLLQQIVCDEMAASIKNKEIPACPPNHGCIKLIDILKKAVLANQPSVCASEGELATYWASLDYRAFFTEVVPFLGELRQKRIKKNLTTSVLGPAKSAPSVDFADYFMRASRGTLDESASGGALVPVLNEAEMTLSSTGQHAALISETLSTFRSAMEEEEEAAAAAAAGDDEDNPAPQEPRLFINQLTVLPAGQGAAIAPADFAVLQQLLRPPPGSSLVDSSSSGRGGGERHDPYSVHALLLNSGGVTSEALVAVAHQQQHPSSSSSVGSSLYMLGLASNPLSQFSLQHALRHCPSSLLVLDLSYCMVGGGDEGGRLLLRPGCFLGCPQLVRLVLDGCGLRNLLTDAVTVAPPASVAGIASPCPSPMPPQMQGKKGGDVFVKGQRVLYVTSSDPAEAQLVEAVVLKAHPDDDPDDLFYTITIPSMANKEKQTIGSRLKAIGAAAGGAAAVADGATSSSSVTLTAEGFFQQITSVAASAPDTATQQAQAWLSILCGLSQLRELSLRENQLADSRSITMGLLQAVALPVPAASTANGKAAARPPPPCAPPCPRLQHLWLAENPISENSASDFNSCKDMLFAQLKFLAAVDGKPRVVDTKGTGGLKGKKHSGDPSDDLLMAGEKEYLATLKGERDFTTVA